MIQQALKPVNKRRLLLHINIMQHNQTALKRRVGGIYDPHQACLNILINSLKGDVSAETWQTTYQNSDMILKRPPPPSIPKFESSPQKITQ